MDFIKPSNAIANYRIIIRDENTSKSKSFGIYNQESDLISFFTMIKKYIKEIKEEDNNE